MRYAGVFVAVVLILAGLTAPTAGYAAPPVTTCELGAYLSDVYDLDAADDTFAARVRLWSLCPAAYQDPLSHLSLPTNAGAGVGPTTVSARGDRYWSSAILQGPFRYHWNVDDFPFDRHSLTILITAPADETAFRFVADTRDSSANPAIAVPGWRLTGFHIAEIDQHLVSNFGDPDLPTSAGSTFSRIALTIDLTREQPVAFWKTVGPLFILILVTAVLFVVVEVDASSSRSQLAALGGAMLTVLFNMTRADDQAPSNGVTMLDVLHILAMGWILVAVVVVTLAWRWGTAAPGDGPDRERSMRRVSLLYRGGILLGTVAYAGATVAVVLGAH